MRLSVDWTNVGPADCVVGLKPQLFDATDALDISLGKIMSMFMQVTVHISRVVNTPLNPQSQFLYWIGDFSYTWIYFYGFFVAGFCHHTSTQVRYINHHPRQDK